MAERACPGLSVINCLALCKMLIYKRESTFPAKPRRARAPELLVHKAADVGLLQDQGLCMGRNKAGARKPA